MRTLYIFLLFTLMISCEAQKKSITPETAKNEDVISKEPGAIPKNEAEEMLKLHSEILKMAHNVKCENPKEWKYVGVGHKACGGFSSYIPYSTKIDENKFLDLVRRYNEKSDFLNKKYHLMSDCMMVLEPSGITCNNGKAIFKKNSSPPEVAY